MLNGRLTLSVLFYILLCSTVAFAQGVLVGVETVKEFRVLTSTYSAEYGRASGGVFVAVTKSGTNELHGSAFEFLRNDVFDARNFFDRTIPRQAVGWHWTRGLAALDPRLLYVSLLGTSKSTGRIVTKGDKK